jgi:Tol biopolymer transport system component
MPVSFGRRFVLVAVGVAVAGAMVAVPGTAQAAFPGVNGRIVFATEFTRPSQIFSMRPDGSGLRQLTHLKKGHSAKMPEWSPDGTRIAYVRDGQVWVMDADGSGKTRVTSTDGFRDKNPSWSPDGTRIVFSHCDVSFGQSAYCDIAGVDVDGSSFATILDDNWVNDAPAYSPDGSKIAFSGTRGGYVSAVWVMDADGTDPVRLTDPAMQAGRPEWSPDGSLIAFATHTELPNSEVFAMSPDGTGQRRLTPAGGDWVNPQFSPDGTAIAVLGPNTADPDTCCWDLYTMAPDGTGLSIIDHPRAGMVGLDWGPKAVAA